MHLEPRWFEPKWLLSLFLSFFRAGYGLTATASPGSCPARVGLHCPTLFLSFVQAMEEGPSPPPGVIAQPVLGRQSGSPLVVSRLGAISQHNLAHSLFLSFFHAGIGLLHGEQPGRLPSPCWASWFQRNSFFLSFVQAMEKGLFPLLRASLPSPCWACTASLPLVAPSTGKSALGGRPLKCKCCFPECWSL